MRDNLLYAPPQTLGPSMTRIDRSYNSVFDSTVSLTRIFAACVSQKDNMIKKLLLFAAFALGSRAATVLPSISPGQGAAAEIVRPDAAYTRRVFYLGGDYYKTATGTVLQNQIYIEQLTPAAGKTQSHPIIMLHGGDISGIVWLNKPDNGTGWASFFLNKGYEVFLVDEWSVGRSGPESTVYTATDGSGTGYEIAEVAFSAPQLYNKYYQARFHTQWPGVNYTSDKMSSILNNQELTIIFS